MVNSVVLKNASIIDGSGSAPYSGHLVIKKNKIDSIHQEDAFSHDTEASIIDLKGKTVMPGLLMLIVILVSMNPDPMTNSFFIEERG